MVALFEKLRTGAEEIVSFQSHGRWPGHVTREHITTRSGSLPPAWAHLGSHPVFLPHPSAWDPLHSVDSGLKPHLGHTLAV